MSIGTLDWMQRSGVLTLTERWRLTIAAIVKRERLRRHAVAHGASCSLSTLDRLGLGSLEYLQHPWNALAFAASTAAQELQPRWLTNHGWRTYAWGTLLALDTKLEYDKNLLFSACMLHDIGLTPQTGTPADQCFSMRGARVARAILQCAGASEDQLHRVAEAITLHLNFEVGVERSVEAHLLHAGVTMDVLGQRSREIPALLQHAVLVAYPRLGFKKAFCSCAQAEAKLAPRSRMGLYVRRLGFVELIQQAPFDE